MSGFVVQIIGPVVDVEFPEGALPGIYNSIEILKASVNNGTTTSVLGSK